MSSLLLSEEQLSIRKTARDFVREHLPITAFRALRDTRDPDGFSRDAWAALADLGFAGICLPERVGGSGLGYAELGLVLEECGRQLAATPFIASVVLAGSAIELGGSEEHTGRLADVAAGRQLLAFAHDEGTHHAPANIATTATRSGDGYTLDGTKSFVLDGHVADALVVVARAGDAVAMFLVPADADGLEVTRLTTVDHRNVARAHLDSVTVPSSARLPGADAATLDAVLDRGRVALAAEMLGGALEAFERTLDYLKEREQFGVKIGSFQALKHRAARMFSELELTKSVVLAALRAIDDGRDDLGILASTAKARASDVFTHVAAEAIQMHGGIGMTDEHDIGLFYKRARVCELAFGDAAFHRDRFARLSGY